MPLSPWLYLPLVLVACWVVGRLVVFLPAQYAEEEQAFMAALAAKGDSAESFVIPPENPATANFWRRFLTVPPLFSGRQSVACLGVVVVAAWVALHTTSPLPLLLWLLFGCALIVLALVDYQIRLLPDVLTLSMLWLGLVIQLFPDTRTVGLEMAVIGAVAGYLPLWILAKVYFLIRQRDGLGMGDLKLLAAMGAWSGAGVLPRVVFVAALLAILAVVARRLLAAHRLSLQEELPFGPWLILAYMLVLTQMSW